MRADRRAFPGRRLRLCEGALAAGANFAAGYPITPSTEIVERFASRIPTVGRRLPPDGGRTGLLDCHRGRGVGRRQGFHGHLRPGLLPDDGAPGLRRHDGDSPGAGGRAARRALHGLAHPAGPGRHDAGALGVARRLRNHRPVPQLAAGMLRPDDRRLQSGGGIPHAGAGDDGRVRGPHDGEGGDSRPPRRSRFFPGVTLPCPLRNICPSGRGRTAFRKW